MLLRYVILSLLRDEAMHGYRIKSVFEERLGRTWPLNFGQIYSVLKELRRRGSIVGRLESKGNHMGRWVYEATPRGRRSLAVWLARKPRDPVPGRNEILVRLLAVGSDGIDATRAQLENQEGVYRAYLEDLHHRRRALAGRNEPGARSDMFAELAIDAAIYQAEAHLRWLQHCSRTLDGTSSEPSQAQVEQQRLALPLRKRQRRADHAPAPRAQSA